MAKTDRAAIEGGLDPSQRQAFEDLLADYKAAAKEHVPGYVGGGISLRIAAALVQSGWRKQPNPN
jgi:hypothetical protein